MRNRKKNLTIQESAGTIEGLIKISYPVRTIEPRIPYNSYVRVIRSYFRSYFQFNYANGKCTLSHHFL